MQSNYTLGVLLTGLLALGVVSCGPSSRTPASQIKPGQLKAGEGLDQSDLGCNDPGDEAEILVVDLPSSRRGDIEVLMSEGLVAVNYDCNKLKILQGCKVPGSYAYKGTLLREEVLSLENGDEIRANLPLSGAGVAAKMEGSIERGATLELATVMVGQQRAARYEVARDELSGRCDGATHFVQSIYVGAFAMRRGERAKMGATAEVFGTGAAAGSNSDSSLQNTDGDLEACRRTDSNAEAPEAGCGTPLRLYMLPISPEGSALKPPREVVSVPPCPEGMARQGGKCVKATTGPVCGEESPGACEAPCQKGDGLACGVYGLAQARGEGGLAKDSAAAAANLSRGCELGSGNACYYTGILYREGQGVTKDLGRSVQLSERGCALGNGHACYEAGLSYEKGEGVTANGGRAFSYYEQGCAAGDANACNNVGTFYSKGTQGVQADPAKAAGLYRRACEAGSKTGCFNVALDYAQGNGVAQDDAKSVQYGTRACQLGHARSCYIVGGMKKDQALIQRACKLGYADACTP